ncbi:MAG: hypothetical protein KDJ44_05480 [Rhodoblastus sp.]|nr:hypothetical protein [Rhodoblastus sp.]MCC0006284.1 hypothetical protein [Methylobacteriaceae bacterium]
MTESLPATITRQIDSEIALIPQFAAVVAKELEEFGLSKQKVDEIMLRSAQSFGSNISLAAVVDQTLRADEKNPEVSYFEWFKAAGGTAATYLASTASKHAPDLVDRLAPKVADALHLAISNYLDSLTRPSSRSTSKKGKRRSAS